MRTRRRRVCASQATAAVYSSLAASCLLNREMAAAIRARGKRPNSWKARWSTRLRNVAAFLLIGGAAPRDEQKAEEPQGQSHSLTAAPRCHAVVGAQNRHALDCSCNLAARVEQSSPATRQRDVSGTQFRTAISARCNFGSEQFRSNIRLGVYSKFLISYLIL